MSMDLDDLESRFHTLADDLSAPATDDARVAIGRRSRVLRRRRHTRRAVGSTFVVVALVAGIAALQNRLGEDGGPQDGDPAGPPDVSAGQPPSGLPTWTVDAPGWRVTAAHDGVDGPEPENFGPNLLQVFRTGDDLLGPTVVVRHVEGSDMATAPDGSDTVLIGPAEGSIDEVGAGRFAVRWNPGNGDSSAQVDSIGLTRDEVLAFAEGLVPIDDDIAYPAGPGDRFGFEATELPSGIEEVGAMEVGGEALDVRLVELRRGALDASIMADHRGEPAFEAQFADLLIYAERTEQVDIEGHSAYVFEGNVCGCTPRPSINDTLILWRDGDAWVQVTVTALGSELPATVDEVVASLRQISEEEWRELETSALD